MSENKTKPFNTLWSMSFMGSTSEQYSKTNSPVSSTASAALKTISTSTITSNEYITDNNSNKGHDSTQKPEHNVAGPQEQKLQQPRSQLSPAAISTNNDLRTISNNMQILQVNAHKQNSGVSLLTSRTGEENGDKLYGFVEDICHKIRLAVTGIGDGLYQTQMMKAINQYKVYVSFRH